MPKAIPTWEPLLPDMLIDQRALYDSTRARCPVVRSSRGVTLLRHADVVAAAHDPAAYSSCVSQRRAIPNGMDPPEHDSWRALVDRYFTPERVAVQEPPIRMVADTIVASLPRGRVVDAMSAMCKPFAVRAQTKWLGWEDLDDELLVWMDDNHAATRSGERARTAAVASAFDSLIRAQLKRHRAMGSGALEDPTTALLSDSHLGVQLAEEDIVSILRNWTAGDLGSIAAAMGVVVWFLATHGEVQQQLRKDPQGLATAIDEMLRIDDPFLVNRRRTSRTVAVGDHVLEADTLVYLNWNSANRDEAVFGDPDAYDPVRHAANNLVWGTGIHVCPGRPLAIMELTVAASSLLRATNCIEPSSDVAPVRETYPQGGWRRLPVVLR